MPYEADLQAALEAVKATHDPIFEAYSKLTPIPGAAASITLPIDRQTQEILLQSLSHAFPGDAFLAEEETPTLARLPGVDSGRDRLWIIDPIDGTRGFAVKNGEFAVMVALLSQGQLAIGVVYEVVQERLTYALRGGGCWRCDHGASPVRCRVRDTADLAAATMTVTHSPSYGPGSPLVKALGVAKLVPSYSAGRKLVLVARGEADLFLNTYPAFNDWDIAAGHILVEEAGGQVSDFEGQRIQYGAGRGMQKRGLLASNGLIHAAALKKVVSSQ
jgi:3'(2'), 5'-bisphosphate nucleotidase